MSVPVSTPMTTRSGINNFKFVNIKCGGRTLKAVVDTGAQISVVREDLLGTRSRKGKGTIQIISEFSKKEIAALRIFDMKIDEDMHCFVPIICSVSKKLVSDMLIYTTSYELLLEKIQLSNLEFPENFDNSDNKSMSEMNE